MKCPKFVMDPSQNPDPRNPENKSGFKSKKSLDPDQAKKYESGFNEYGSTKPGKIDKR
jgi:hypothetical protein